MYAKKVCIPNFIRSNSKWNFKSTSMETLKRIGFSFLLIAVVPFSVFAQIGKVVDLNEVNGTNFGFIIEGEAAGDQLGRSTLFADVNGDGYDDLIIHAGTRNPTGNNRGMVYAIFGGKDLPTSTLDISNLNGTNGFVLMGEFSDGSFGARMASGDINGDDLEDLIIADPSASPFGRPATAAVYVVFGQSSWSDTLRVTDFDGSDGFRIYGDRYEDPEYVASGDLNDDGYDDIIIGSDYSSDPDIYEGRVTVIYGKPSAFEEEISTLESSSGSHGPVFIGTVAEDRFGHGLATGDFNNDGKTDLFASAPFYHRNFSERGRIYVVLGNDTTYSGNRSISTLTDETNGFYLSESSSGCCHYAGQELKSGDTNGDGYDDIIIGIQNYNSGGSTARREGRVVVYRGNLSTGHNSFGKTGSFPYASINGITDGDRTGYSLAIDDINGDGNDDIIIGAYVAKLDGVTETGAVFVIYGPVLSDIDLEDLTEEQGFVLRGDELSRAGINVSTGDMNNDGFPEIVIGSYHNSPNGSQSGEVYVITNIASQTISGDEGFRMLSSPAQGTTFKNILAPFWTQGFTNSDAESGTDPNVWIWDNQGQEWEVLSDQDTASLAPGNGFLMYQFGNDNNSGENEGFPKQINAVGSLYPALNGVIEPNSNSLTPISELSDGNYFLLGNPFPFTIDWDAVAGWSKTNISETIQVWSDSANQWYDWNGMTGSKPDSGLIKSFESVFIQADGGNGELTLSTETEADTNLTQLKGDQNKRFETIKVTVSNEELRSTFNILFHDKGQFGKDKFDAILLEPLSGKYILGGIYDNGAYSLASLPDSLYHNYQLPLILKASETGSDAELQIDSYNQNISVALIDREMGTKTDLGSSNSVKIKLDMVDTDKGASFRLSEKGLEQAKAKSGENLRYSLIINKGKSVVREDELKYTLELYQNYPNPFNPSTVIRFQLPMRSEVSLKVFDMLGREVATLIDGRMNAGYHSVDFDADHLASGIYIYQLQTEEQVFTKKLTLIK